MASILIGLVVFSVVVYGMRLVWHRFFGAPLDPTAERERLRQDLKRSYRVARWCLRQMLRR